MQVLMDHVTRVDESEAREVTYVSN